MSYLSELRIEELADGVFRLGTGYVGFYLLADRGKYTIIDSGLPGYWGQLVEFLDRRNATFDDIEAQVLTHHHPDHHGLAARLQESGVTDVRIHHTDAAGLARRERPPSVPLWRPRVFRFFLHTVRRGAARIGPIESAATFGDGATLDVPGRPRVIHVPGHTEGHCCLYVGESKTVFAGDALVGMDLVTGKIGPRISPGFTNDDSEMAFESLSHLDGLDADLVLPVHGPYWRGSISEALRRAREIGVY